eukprot:5338212-Pyramimonas_sp.AAC.1
MNAMTSQHAAAKRYIAREKEPALFHSTPEFAVPRLEILEGQIFYEFVVLGLSGRGIDTVSLAALISRASRRWGSSPVASLNIMPIVISCSPKMVLKLSETSRAPS